MELLFELKNELKINGGTMNLRLSIVALAATSALVLTGCSTAASSPEKTDSDSVEVEQGFFEVSITIPASIIGEQDFASYESEMLSKGATSVTQNEDGSVTIKMPDAVHKAMLDEMKASLDESIDQALVDQAGVITDIEYSSNVDEFTVEVDKAAYESSFGAGFISLSLGIQGMFYQLFDGVSDAKVTVNFVDVATGEVFESVVYPDAMQGAE